VNLDALIKLAKVFCRSVELTKGSDGLYLVHIRSVWFKEDPKSCMKGSIFGSGDSVELACRDYLNKAKGRLLIGDDPDYYGEKRPEFICV